MAGAAMVLAPVASAAATPPFITSRRFIADYLRFSVLLGFYNDRGTY
jgi:hypothetical protein